ncbi:hypothetical protein EB233_30095 [Mesorhizobium erdmanii]|uniref:Uncharacterized protein n=1 Tax=Mesorhizobium erdmanii TaxID=1777866 RepID=A0A6M7UT41_9HYPH|nr:hypothetical protein EB233_30095 [Mesorhizobium erdmanii]
MKMSRLFCANVLYLCESRPESGGSQDFQSMMHHTTQVSLWLPFAKCWHGPWSADQITTTEHAGLEKIAKFWTILLAQQ